MVGDVKWMENHMMGPNTHGEAFIPGNIVSDMRWLVEAMASCPMESNELHI